MFKRVLVLVLFLFGVFWWLTHRNGDDVEKNPTTDTVAEETAAEESTEETEDSDDEGEESSDDEAEETSEETEAETTGATEVAPTVSENIQAAVVQPSVSTPVASATTPAVAPVPAAPAPQPVVTVPVVPERTTDVKVFMYEWNVDLSDKTIPAGTVNFKVQNDGRFTHDFNISGFGNLGKVMPSETRTFTVKLRAGEYEAFSERRQDYERGVREDFTVTP